jgi:hypothetical protein
LVHEVTLLELCFSGPFSAALLREFGSRIHFQSRGTEVMGANAMRWRDESPSGEGASWPPLPDGIILDNPRKDHWRPTSITIAIKDTDKVNHLKKAIFTSAEGCTGVEAKQEGCTEQEISSSFITNTVCPAPHPDWSEFGFTVSS